MSWIERQAEQAIRRVERQQEQRTWSMFRRQRIAVEWTRIWRAIVQGVRASIEQYNAKCAGTVIPPLDFEAATAEEFRVRRDAGRRAGVYSIEVVANENGVTRSSGNFAEYYEFDMDDEERIGLRVGVRLCTPEEAVEFLLRPLF